MSIGAISRYVALGDSTTEGLEDPYAGSSEYRGWADRLAERLATLHPDVLYANLAVRGRKLGQIRSEQLAPALAMEPDLVSVVGGVNDVLRPRADVDALAAELDAMVAALTGAGSSILLMTYPDFGEVMAVARRVSPRLRAFNLSVRTIAGQYGAALMDLEAGGVTDARLFHPDRLHANGAGHERIASAAGEALGLPGGGAAWREPLPPTPPASRLQALREDARWARAHLAPWVGRRLRGVSSGDGVPPKRPELAPVTPTSERRAS
jgi:lysophospholipase L1-like esterase